MKKHLFILGALMMSGGILLAQEQVESDAVTDTYSRSSISPISIVYSDGNDRYLTSGIKAIDFGGKFDLNEIPTTTLSVRGDRAIMTDSAINDVLNSNNIGKEIISYWFNRKPDGTMDDSRMQQRSRYNATDQDVLNDQAAKVKTIADMGGKLLRDSYIIAFDAKNFEIRESTDSKGNKTISHQVDMRAYVYQIDISEAFLQDIYSNVWIYDDDDANTKAQKKQNFENLEVPMKLIASVRASSSADEGYSTAITQSYEALLRKLENKISAWQVTTPVYQVHPIMAKIGTKEGLKNGSRYAVYKYVEDKQGNLTTEKRGLIRATTIADNKGEATGESAMSRFYQISGYPVKEGMLLKQSNDLKMGISVSPSLGGYSIGNVRIDYLSHISNHGCLSLFFINIGYDLADMYLDGEKMDGDEKWSYANGSIGYGLGLPLSRKIELQPFVSAGCDYLLILDEDYKDQYEDELFGIFADAGLRFSVTPIYPVQLFAQADYSLLIKEGEVYQRFNESKSSFLGMEGSNRFGLGISAGIRVAF